MGSFKDLGKKKPKTIWIPLKLIYEVAVFLVETIKRRKKK